MDSIEKQSVMYNCSRQEQKQVCLPRLLSNKIAPEYWGELVRKTASAVDIGERNSKQLARYHNSREAIHTNLVPDENRRARRHEVVQDPVQPERGRYAE